MGDEENKLYRYITRLISNNVRIKEVEDELICSKNVVLGRYSPKVGYKELFKDL